MDGLVGAMVTERSPFCISGTNPAWDGPCPSPALLCFRQYGAVTTLGFFGSPPERVNLASKSRSGAPQGSLSDLLKGLAPRSRNANQPRGPNLTSSIPPNPSQGTLKIGNYARAARHRLFITSSPSVGNQTPPVTARCRAAGLWPWPRGLAALTPTGGPPQILSGPAASPLRHRGLCSTPSYTPWAAPGPPLAGSGLPGFLLAHG